MTRCTNDPISRLSCVEPSSLALRLRRRSRLWLERQQGAGGGQLFCAEHCFSAALRCQVGAALNFNSAV